MFILYSFVYAGFPTQGTLVGYVNNIQIPRAQFTADMTPTVRPHTWTSRSPASLSTSVSGVISEILGTRTLWTFGTVQFLFKWLGWLETRWFCHVDYKGFIILDIG